MFLTDTRSYSRIGYIKHVRRQSCSKIDLSMKVAYFHQTDNRNLRAVAEATRYDCKIFKTPIALNSLYCKSGRLLTSF